MRRFFSLLIFMSCALAACNGSTPQELSEKEQQLLGTWESIEPIVVYTDSDVTVTLSYSAFTYKADRTSSGIMELETMAPGLDAGPVKTRSTDTYTWSISGQKLNETTTSSSVEALNYKELMADSVAEIEQDAVNDPESVSEIKLLSDTQLILYEPLDDITIKLKKTAAPANPQNLPSSDGDDSP